MNVENECTYSKKAHVTHNMKFDILDIILSIQNQGIFNDYKS